MIDCVKLLFGVCNGGQGFEQSLYDRFITETAYRQGPG